MSNEALAGEIFLKLAERYNERKKANNDFSLEGKDPYFDFPEGQEKFFEDILKTLAMNSRNQADAILSSVSQVMAEYIRTVKN